MVKTFLTKEHRKTCYTEETDNDIAQTTLMSSISDKPDKNGHDSSHGVYRHCQQLRSDGRIAKTLYNGGDEEGECIERSIAAHVDDHASVGLPVPQSRPDIGHFEFFVLGTRLVIFL